MAKLVGKWSLLKSENFDDYMKAVGEYNHRFYISMVLLHPVL